MTWEEGMKWAAKVADGQCGLTDGSKAGDESKLTQAEIRAAIHCRWSEENIKELAKVNPVLAKKTCAKFLESTNDLSKKFSELGKVQVTKEPESKTATEHKAESKPEKKAVHKGPLRSLPTAGS